MINPNIAMAASTIIPRLSIIKLPSLSVLFSIPYKFFWIFWSKESEILNTFSCKYYCAFSLKEALSSRKSVMVSKNTYMLSGTFDNANFKEKLINCKVFISDHILCIICDLFKICHSCGPYKKNWRTRLPVNIYIRD